MKHAYLVVGPESSGTRLVTKLLIDAGCFGDGEHIQRLDKPGDPTGILLDEQVLPKDDTPIVWRRSLPHGGLWVDPAKLIEQLKGVGYEVWVVVTTRDWYPMVRSQIRTHRHVTSQEVGIRNTQKAYKIIFGSLGETKFLVVSYESITRFRRRAVRRILETLQLVRPRLVNHIADGNAKYYGR